MQCGADPGIIVEGLTKREQRLLEQLSVSDPRLDVWTTALSRGWSPSRMEVFLAKIPPEVFVPAPCPDPTPTDRYWSLIDLVSRVWDPERSTQHTGSVASGKTVRSRKSVRSGKSVFVEGIDEVGLGLVEVLAGAGVGRLVLGDRNLVGDGDIGPRGYREVDRGLAREDAAVRILRPRFAGTQLHALPLGVRARAGTGAHAAGHRPPAPDADLASDVDLVVSVSHGVSDPRQAASYVAAGLVHLPVVVRELDVMIGPLIAPTHGPCLRCIHLAMVDADERWPAIAAQLAVRQPSGADPVLLTSAIAFTAHQVVAFLDHRETLIAGVSLHVDAVHPIPRHQQWQVHPRCGCDPSIWPADPQLPAPEPNPGLDPTGGPGPTGPLEATATLDATGTSVTTSKPVPASDPAGGS